MRITSGAGTAKALMTGIGNSARQTWPENIKHRSVSISFGTLAELGKISVQKFDGRTISDSTKFPSVVFGSRLSPQGNNKPTYEYRVLDQTFDGASVSVETTVSSSPKTLMFPSMLVLSAKNDDTGDIVGVEYGSNGVRVLSLLGATIRHEYTVPYTISAGSKVRAERFLSWIQVFVNGVRIGATTHPSFNSIGSPGVGLYSSVAPALSTPIGPTVIEGGTSFLRTFGGRGQFTTDIVLPPDEYVNIARVYIEGGRSMRVTTRNARWYNGVFGTNRGFSLKLNGTHIGFIGDLNGTDLVTSNPFTVPKDSIISVDAMSAATQDPNRIVKSGSIEVFPA